MVAQVSYLHNVRALGSADAETTIEPGTHGIALARNGAPFVLLVPQVASDDRLDAAGFLDALGRKAGLPALGWREPDVTLFCFEAHELIVRQDPGAEARPRKEASATDAAAAWLAARVGRDGQVAFAVDARTQQTQLAGLMNHGRAAVVVQALAAHGGHASTVQRARKWLQREIDAALAGKEVAGWPDRPAMVAGTLALAHFAGVPMAEALHAFARNPALASEPWHGGQVAAALGVDTPAAVWRACVADLARQPWAPWVTMAAWRLRDADVLARCERALVDSVRTRAPHAGGVEENLALPTAARGASAVTVPQIAQTAVSVEALALLGTKAARSAAARGRAFVQRWQLTPGRIPAPLDPALAAGAFRATPIVDWLRADVTAHALLALLAGAR